MSISVKEISINSKKDKKKFFKFLIDLYKGNKYAAPNLYSDETGEFDPEVNDAFRFCECRMFLAYSGRKIVGRIAGIWHKGVNEKNNSKQLRFTRFDVINDIEVTKSLFRPLVEWAKQIGMEEIIGPMSFSDLNEEGMLIEGFDRNSTYQEIYNYPYYVEHMELLGARKVVDWNCYLIKVPEQRDERLARIADYVVKRNGYEVADVYALAKQRDKKPLRNLMMKCLNEVMNEAFEDLYGTSPLSEKQQKREVDMLMQVFVPELACAVLKDGKVICYGLCMPSMLKVLQKGKGHIVPFGIVPYIQTMSHPEVADMMSIGIANDHKNLGAVSVILNHVLDGCIKLGVKYLETGPELEDNRNVQNLWKNYDRALVKRHRCYGMNVEELDKLLNG
ncbi:MAG: hypothetical protein NC099_01030 [Corallococcus sp.]|nr:hypothetical protein [Bacillota bacterium]MCM1533217.1 hypothetical protein [Corallococcus sp.]